MPVPASTQRRGRLRRSVRISDGWIRAGRVGAVLAAAVATVVLVTANGQAFGPVGFGMGMADSCVPSVTFFGEVEITNDNGATRGQLLWHPTVSGHYDCRAHRRRPGCERESPWARWRGAWITASRPWSPPTSARSMATKRSPTSDRIGVGTRRYLTARIAPRGCHPPTRTITAQRHTRHPHGCWCRSDRRASGDP